MTFEIEKGIPMPGIIRASKYPFRDMEIGDSFLAEGTATYHVSRAAIHFAERNPEFKFSCRKVEGGTRVWRIARD